MVADGGTIARAVYVILEDDVADKEVCARFVGADFLSDGEYDASMSRGADGCSYGASKPRPARRIP